MTNTSMAIANEFLRMPGAKGSLTQMQLQKLAYIAHGWNLALNGEPLIYDPVQAWDFGPVFPELYDHAKYFGKNPISRLITDQDNNRFAFFESDDEPSGDPYVADLTPREREIIEQVWRKYGPYSAFKLSDLTHKPGTPWYTTYFGKGKNARMSDEVIREHYLTLASLASAA